MNRIRFCTAVLAAFLFCVAPAAAQVEVGRAAALDYLGRGTAAFRAGDIIGFMKGRAFHATTRNRPASPAS